MAVTAKLQTCISNTMTPMPMMSAKS